MKLRMRMTRHGLQALYLPLLCVLCICAQAVEITDVRGVTRDFAQPPQRVVSLLPSLTESVCALGQCSRLVGVDRYSNFPASLKSLPQLGGGLDPNIEAIVALRPDVVLLARSSRAADRLEALGLRVVALEPKTHADVFKVMQTLGLLLGVAPDDVQQRWQRIQLGVDAAARSVPAAARGQRVYFEVSRGPYAAGEASFIGETLQKMGLRNVVGAELGPFPRLNPEFLVRADPDLIMMGNRSMQERINYPGWETLRAVRAQRVCVFDVADSDVIVRPGPRLDEAAQAMARCLSRIMGGGGRAP
jgi:iron complex transport system substrate-binding protein